MSQIRTELRVFVVDDESLIATTMGLVLRQNGFEAHPFFFPNEALEAAGEMTPDLLLTDVIMPEISGVELALEIMKRYPKCKILLFSGNPAASEALAKARENGNVFEVLAKPIHPTVLLEKIRTVMSA